MAEFKNETEFQSWLENRPIDWSLLLATRTALRALPGLSMLIRLNGGLSEATRQQVILPSFRALAINILCLRKALFNTDIKLKPSLLNIRQAFQAGTSILPSSTAAKSAFISIELAASCADAFLEGNSNALGVSASLASLAIKLAGDWSQSNIEVEILRRSGDTEKLIGRPIWNVEKLPELYDERNLRIVENWRQLKLELLKYDEENWSVWTDWYENLLAGSMPNNWDIEVKCTLISNEIWDQGPAIVNAEIKRIRQGGTKREPASESVIEPWDQDYDVAEPMLGQRPASFQFRAAGDKVDVAAADALPIDPDISYDFYEEVKRKALEFKDRASRAQFDERVRKTTQLLLQRLGNEYADIRPGLLLSALRSLEADVRAYDNEEGRKQIFPDAIAALIDLTDTTRGLCATFPVSREIEAEAVSLNLPMEHIGEIEERLDEIADAASISDGVTPAAQEALIVSAINAGEGRSLADRAKQAAYRLLDNGNFVRAGIKLLKDKGQKISATTSIALKSAAGEAAGLGKDSWRSLRKGFPKGVEQGAKSVGKAVIVGGAAVLMGKIAGPIAALGTLIGSYWTLGKQIEEMTQADAGIDGEVAGRPSDAEKRDDAKATATSRTTRKKPAKTARKKTK